MIALTLRLVAATLLTLAVPATASETVTVFAAASLKNALDNAGQAFTTKTGIAVRVSYGASSALAKQIESGAPADIFASADLNWMDYLDEKGLIAKASRINLLGNTLVVVAPAASKLDRLELTAEAFDRAVGEGRWATGTVASVPVGIYAKEALETLGLWTSAERTLAQTDNVRAALQFVSRGEAALGIVYRTDANADTGVKVVATFPETSHKPIVYPFALTKAATGEAPGTFLAFLESAEGRPFFEAQGFDILGD
jgi:molybdate transport system substrate-binding protein